MADLIFFGRCGCGWKRGTLRLLLSSMRMIWSNTIGKSISMWCYYPLTGFGLSSDSNTGWYLVYSSQTFLS